MAVATEHLLYVPMPLTGSDWIEKILVQCGGVRSSSRFEPVTASWVGERVLLGSVRDPWSWYLALWQVLSVKTEYQVLLRQFGRGRTTFEAFLEGATDSTTWMAVAPRFPLWDLPVGSDGLYTETFKSIYDGGRGLGALIDFAQVEAGLSEVLGVSVSGFPSRTLSNQYTADTEDVVRQADGLLANELGYDKPFSHMPRATRWGGV